VSGLAGAIIGAAIYEGLHPDDVLGTGHFAGTAALGAVVALIAGLLHNFGALRVRRPE
jgi:hypothetical protein